MPDRQIIADLFTLRVSEPAPAAVGVQRWGVRSTPPLDQHFARLRSQKAPDYVDRRDVDLSAQPMIPDIGALKPAEMALTATRTPKWKVVAARTPMGPPRPQSCGKTVDMPRDAIRRVDDGRK